MRRALIIEKSEEEKVGISTVRNSNTVSVTVLEGNGDSQVILTVAQAKELRDALDELIPVAEKPEWQDLGYLSELGLGSYYAYAFPHYVSHGSFV